MALWEFPYGEQFRDFINPESIVVSRNPGLEAKRVEIDYNPLTHDIQGISLKDADSAFPVGSANEHQWERIINWNLGLEIKRALMQNIMGPVIEKFSYGATGLMDILTLGIFGFNKGHKEISDKITAELIDKYVDKRKVFAVLGVPEESWASPTQGGGNLPGSPFPGIFRRTATFDYDSGKGLYLSDDFNEKNIVKTYGSFEDVFKDFELDEETGLYMMKDPDGFSLDEETGLYLKDEKISDDDMMPKEYALVKGNDGKGYIIEAPDEELIGMLYNSGEDSFTYKRVA